MRRVQSCIAVPEEDPETDNQLSVMTPDLCRMKTSSPCEEQGDANELQFICPKTCTVGVHTDVGGCPFMEDAHLVHRTERDAFFCVYDGHGGAAAAHYCRDHLHLRILSSLGRGNTPADALLDGFARTEADLVLEQRLQLAERVAATGSELCGATALVALLREGSLHLAWLGDCRAVLCRGGEAVELTRDHVLSGGADCSERARVLGEGGEIEGGRLSGFLEVARAFGDLDPATGCKPVGLSAAPELSAQQLQADDEFVLLGSDGLWQLVDSQAAVRLARADLRAHADAGMAAEKLVETALARKADDNIMAMVVLLRPPAPDTSARQRPRLPFMKRAASVPAALSTGVAVVAAPGDG